MKFAVRCQIAFRRITNDIAGFVAGSGVVLAVGCAPALAAQGRTTTSAPSAPGSLGGSVVTEVTERPLMNAEVTIAKLGLSARTDSAGNFSLTGIPAGEYAVAIRLAGFESVFTTLTFAAAQKIEADFLLKDRVIQFAPKSELQRLGMNPDLGKNTFDERRSTGLGKYIGADGYIVSDAVATSDLIREKLPLLHANAIGRAQQALASREPRNANAPFVRGDASDVKAGAKLDCYVQVFLNATLVYRPTPDQKLFDVNSIPARLLLSVEYYAANDTPAKYAGVGSHCGTLLVWTRGR